MSSFKVFTKETDDEIIMNAKLAAHDMLIDSREIIDAALALQFILETHGINSEVEEFWIDD